MHQYCLTGEDKYLLRNHPWLLPGLAVLYDNDTYSKYLTLFNFYCFEPRIISWMLAVIEQLPHYSWSFVAQ